jgi:glucose-1-phosphatase
LRGDPSIDLSVKIGILARMIRVVLFDLGGVLVELGGVSEFAGMIGVSDPQQVWARWLGSPAVRRFETGRCTSDEFGCEAVAEFGLGLEPAVFLDRFLSWPRGLFQGAELLVRELRDDVIPACLSNTNQLHWDRQLGAPVLKELFRHWFLSHELGLIKPDAEVFTHVVEKLACAPGEILFLDDNMLNVEGARSVGLDAHRVEGVTQARALLELRGLLRQ